MPNNLRLLVLALCFGLAAVAQAQPQWRFHLAFEDGTGARDTIWHIWDETATAGSWSFQDVDYHLGEGRVEMDLNAFNVYTGNWDGDSTKTLALPYSNWFPLFQGEQIHAFNYTYPITIRWDRSLFHAPFLPDPQAITYAVMNGQYFFHFGTDPYGNLFNMMDADSVVVSLDALWAPLFATTLLIGHHDGDPIGVPRNQEVPWGLTTNGEQVHVSGSAIMQEVEVWDVGGRLLARKYPGDTNAQFDISSWPVGLYVLRIRSSLNRTHHAKFIKVE